MPNLLADKPQILCDLESSSDFSEIRPLMLAFWAPPVIRPQAILLGKMIPEWIRRGVTPVIARYSHSGEWATGAKLIDVERPGPRLGPFARLFRGFPRRRYYNRVVRLLEPLIEKHNINVIYSFANPNDCNIVGAILSRRMRIPLVAHFSDPWTGTVQKPSHGFRSLQTIRAEKSVVSTARRITTPEPAMTRFIQQKYHSKTQAKFRTVNHCFSSNLYPDPEPNVDGRFVISHVGTMYPGRTPESLFRALASIRDKNASVFNRIVLRLVGAETKYGGYTAAEIQELMSRFGLTGQTVSVESPISFRESLCVMRSSDCLVLIDTAEPYFLASKLIDYAGSLQPVIVVARDRSPNSVIANRLGFESFEHDNVEGLASSISRLIAGFDDHKVDRDELSKFDVRQTTTDLFEIFLEVIENPLA